MKAGVKAGGKTVDVALGLVRRHGGWFLQRRDPGNPVLPGRWEFPGGKALPGESMAAALGRELKEELAWEPMDLIALPVIEHLYADRAVRLHPFRCEGGGDPRTALAWGWFTVSEMRRLPIPEANLSFLEMLD